jgi:PPK2 family polyphosphate:nucleotide phosphotransferase
MARAERGDLPSKLRVVPGKACRLRDPDAAATHGWERAAAEAVTADNLRRLGELQFKMYADGRHSLLVVLQAIDGGGKDSTIRRVFGAFNPQGCNVVAFKAPSAEELSRDFLWRVHRHVPARGQVTVFNRSHYEEVLVVRVQGLAPKAVWEPRYAQINDFERMLSESGTRVVKIFLHISHKEQKLRFEERLATREKQWKFDPADLEKRRHWMSYRQAFEAALSRCSTAHAPWHVIPADRKWFRDLAVSQILRREMEALPLAWPKPSYDPSKIRVE